MFLIITPAFLGLFQPNVTTLRLTNGMANPFVCLSVSLSSVTCVHPTQGFNFSGIFPATHPPKITKIVQGDQGITPSEQISLTSVWLCDSSNVAK